MRPAAIRDWLTGEIARATGCDPDAIDVEAPFETYGLSSTDAVVLSGELERLLGRSLSPTLVYEHPTIAALAAALGAEAGMASDAPGPARTTAVAIVGVACRFPGAEDPAAFWRLLHQGRDAIREVPGSRWDAERWYDPDPAAPGKSVSRWGGFLDQIDRFDPFFFGISPGEAERMDPQQRLLLELAFEAFEDAGYPMPRLAGSRTAVLVGISINEYGALHFPGHRQITGHSGTGASLAIAANRISYAFDLHGPSAAVDTACSSSLAAVHLACRSLREGECDLALAGGVNLMLSPAHGIAFTKAGVLAPDGRCKPFDAGANGYVRGEGGGLVVLKPLERALADGDTIYAVIRGTAAGQDGRTNGLMAPNGRAQERLLREAYHDAAVSPARVRYLEAHGTGTLLGDAMEAQAIGAVVGAGRAESPCAIGSVKSNIGHLEAAAGVAGLIKVVLALRHGRLPPSLHVGSPNPHVPFETLGIAVQRSAGPWPPGAGPIVAGVSSFGFGGTNVHAVVEQAPAPPPPTDDPHRALLVPLSAHTTGALREVARRLDEWLSADPSDAPVRLPDLVYTVALRRTHHAHRLALVADSTATLRERLRDALDGTAHPDLLAGERRRGRLAFVFSGQGGQWTGMGRGLWRREPAFRAALERCDQALRPHLGWSVLDRIAAGEIGGDVDAVQPAIFALQVALAEFCRSRGVVPDAVVGHSMGEVAAAWVSGALTLDQAASVIALRSRLLRRLRGSGGMVLVGRPADETLPLLAEAGHRVAVAASNGPRSTVVSGRSEALAALVRRLEQSGIFCRTVDVDVPAHGPEARPLGAELREALATLDPRAPDLELVSAVQPDGGDLPPLDAEYWARNLTEPVEFARAVAELLRRGCTTFVELGPHPVLQSAIQQALVAEGVEGEVIPTLVRGEDDDAALLRALGRLYVSGRTVDWQAIAPPAGRVLSLPTYPWQRERFWLDFPTQIVPAGPGENSHPLLGRRISLGAEPRTWLWEAEAMGVDHAWLRQHRVADEPVLAGAAYVEMARAAATTAGLGDEVELLELGLPRLLVLPEHAGPTVQTRLAPDADGRWGLTVHARPPGAGEWTLHASAQVRAANHRAPPTEAPLDGILARCTARLSGEALYTLLAAHGLRYGAGMRVVAEAWHAGGEALGRLDLSPTIRNATLRLHPALLDGALHTLGALLLRPGELAEGGPFVPVGCGAVRWHGALQDAGWSHVRLRAAATQAGDPDRLDADVRVLDAAGVCVVEIDSLRLARRPHRAAPQPRAQSAWCYQTRWTPAGPPAAASGLADGGRWILVGSGTLAEAVRSRLADAGAACELVDGGSAEGDLRARLRARLHQSAGPVRGIVWLGDGGHPDGTAIASPAETAARSARLALETAQAAAERGPAVGMPRLWLVTRGAQPARPKHLVAPDHATVWGLGRSVALEMPELSCCLVDLDPSAGEAEGAERLATELGQADAEDQIALRGAERLVARLGADPGPEAVPTGGAVRFRPDAGYLITGGLGGLGRTVAGWMVEHGARHLALVGRHAPTPAASATLARIAGGGARVEVLRADVARREEVDALLAHVRAALPPLAGVVHAAGVLENAAVAALDAGRLARVMAPKVSGAWHLHEATRSDPLEFFLLFSSAVSVLGSPGQANYAAGNAFLDALAWYRRGLGLPASSINWGPWAEVGLVADAGLKGLPPAHGLDLLAWVMRTAPTQVAVLPFDLATLLDLYPSAAKLPLFAEVGGQATHVARLYARPRLQEAYVEPRSEVERRLAELWRQTLRIDRVGVRDSFFELGGDSVLAAQILASVHRTLGVEIDVRAAFQAFTIERLAERVEAALVARVDALGEDEVARLLQE